jgi:predicted HAD superfamily hydrolase
MTPMAELRHRIGQRADGQLRVLSVDLFDTLLLRTSAPECERFREVAERWAALPPCCDRGLTTETIFEARWQCAKVAYRAIEPRSGVREARIEDILRLQLLTLRLPVELVPQVLEVELAYEEAALRPNTAVAALCMEARAAGWRIIVASDMYLGEADLRRLLEYHGLGALVDKVYASASIGLTKRSGNLYRHMLREEAVEAGALTHFGDHYDADHCVPRSLGIDAHWLPRAYLWRMAASARAGAAGWLHPNLRLL